MIELAEAEEDEEIYKETLEQLKELEKHENRRQEILGLERAIYELRYWIAEGYKENEGKEFVLEMMAEKIRGLQKKADAILDFIKFKKKENENN